MVESPSHRSMRKVVPLAIYQVVVYTRPMDVREWQSMDGSVLIISYAKLRTLIMNNERIKVEARQARAAQKLAQDAGDVVQVVAATEDLAAAEEAKKLSEQVGSSRGEHHIRLIVERRSILYARERAENRGVPLRALDQCPKSLWSFFLEVHLWVVLRRITA